MIDPLRSHGLYSPQNSPGQNTGVGCLSFLQGIFLTQGSNSHLLLGKWILYRCATWEAHRIGWLPGVLLFLCSEISSDFLVTLRVHSQSGLQSARHQLFPSCPLNIL